MNAARDWIAEITLLDRFPDGEAGGFLRALRESGISPRALRTAKLYRFNADYPERALRRLCRELLSDPVTQEWALRREAAPGPRRGSSRQGWEVEVWLKPAVSDAPAETVAEGIEAMGLPAPKTLRCGQAWRASGKLDSGPFERAALKYLVNPVVHRWTLKKLS